MRLLQYLWEKDISMDTRSRINRAQTMGFDTDTIWFHGTNKAFKEFSAKHLGKSTNAAWGKMGHYFTTDSKLASSFTKGKRWSKPNVKPKMGANVIPVFVRSNPLLVPAHKMMVLSGNEQGVLDIKQDAISKGHNSVIIGTWRDSYGEDDPTTELGTPQLVMFDSRDIRSIFARFDPSEIESDNISEND